MSDVARGLPPASRAATAAYLALAGAAIAVSKPRRGTVAAAASAPAVGPASTRHDLVSVVPFQLA